MCVTHLCYIEHNTHNYSIYIYRGNFHLYRYPTIRVSMLSLKDVLEITLINWCLCLQFMYALPSVIHNLMYQAVAQLSLTLKATVCKYYSNYQKPLCHVLVIQHHDKLRWYMCVPTLIINIAQLHNSIVIHNHLYFHV